MDDRHEEFLFLLGMLSLWIELPGPRQELIDALVQRRINPGHFEGMLRNLTEILEEARVQAQFAHHLA